MSLKTYALARAKEPSTWRGIILLLTSLGVTLDPALAEQIIAVGIAVAGLLAVVTSDKPAAPKPEQE